MSTQKVQEDSADVKKAAESFKDTAKDSAGDLMAQLDVLRTEIEELAVSMGEDGSTRMRAAVERARRAAQGVARDGMHRAEDGMRAATEKAEDLYSDAERFVAEKPTLALGIAAGLGLLAGLFLSRR